MVSELKEELFSLYRRLLKSKYGRVLRYRMGSSFWFGLFYPYEAVLDIQGSAMFLDVHEADPGMRRTFRTYAFNRIHEPETTLLFKDTVKKGDVVLDLGANIGYFSLLAARLVGPTGRVFSFEPEPRNYEYLQKNIELNKYDTVSVFQKAVSNKPEMVRLYICSYDTGHHTIHQSGGIEKYDPRKTNTGGFVEVEAVVLDDFLQRRTQRVDVVKMDVEGAEALALSGMDRIIKTNKKLKMFIEFFPLLINEMGGSPEVFIHQLLDVYGFRMFVIPDDYNASNKKLIEVESYDALMGFCEGEKAHVNLFLTRDEDIYPDGSSGF